MRRMELLFRALSTHVTRVMVNHLASTCVVSHVRLCSPRDCSPTSPSRQEHWSGLPFPPAGDLPDPSVDTGCCASRSWLCPFVTVSSRVSSGAQPGGVLDGRISVSPGGLRGGCWLLRLQQ